MSGSENKCLGKCERPSLEPFLGLCSPTRSHPRSFSVNSCPDMQGIIDAKSAICSSGLGAKARNPAQGRIYFCLGTNIMCLGLENYHFG